MLCSHIQLPETSYPLFDSLPASIVDTGKLSQLQLEGVLYACAKHQELLPSGQSKLPSLIVFKRTVFASQRHISSLASPYRAVLVDSDQAARRCFRGGVLHWRRGWSGQRQADRGHHIGQLCSRPQESSLAVHLHSKTSAYPTQQSFITALVYTYVTSSQR